MYYTSYYKIDFEKVKTLDDVIRILKAKDITFEPDENIEEIKDLVKSVPKNGAPATLD